MSSYDVYFAAPLGSEPPTVDAIRAWLAARPRWKVDASSAEYENPLTGVDLDATIEADADAPKGRAPVVMWMKGLRAHNAIEEAADELEAFAAAFGLHLVEDRDANTTRPWDREWVRTSHDELNRILHKHLLGHLAGDYDEVLDRARLDEVIGWNRRRDALAEASGEGVFVPQILFFERPEAVGTFVAWADGVAARIPPVDAIQTTRGCVPWSAIAEAIEGAQREADHWLVEGTALDAVFAAVERAEAAPPPRLVKTREVLTKDIVDEYLLPVADRAPRRKALDLLNEGRMASFFGKSEKEAVKAMAGAADLVPRDFSVQLEVARFLHERDPAAAVRVAARAVSLDPEYAFLATLGAANAMYCAKWNDALRLADHAIARAPEDRNAHLVRATVLAEVMRFDEAVAACDRALAIQSDAMARNVRSFTLAAAGRAAEAREGYTEALSELDGALAGNGENAELHERRAYALLGLGRPKEALAAAKIALKLAPESLLALQSAGRASVALGRAADAAAALRKVIAKRKTSPMAALYLARAHAMLGQTAERDAALKLAARSPLCAHLAEHDATGGGAAAKKAASQKAAPKKKAATKKAATKKAATKKAGTARRP